MGKKRVPTLNLEQIKALEEGFRNDKNPTYRMRCHLVLLKSQGRSSKEISLLHGYPTQATINNWLTRYEKEGISGLRTSKGQGRKPILNKAAHEAQIKKSVKAERQRLSVAKAEIENELSLTFSTKTLTRFLKKISVGTNE